MDTFEMYNTISESLQCDINDGSISFEYANILNDIAYDIYVEGEMLTKVLQIFSIDT
jgi:hypothetical protein